MFSSADSGFDVVLLDLGGVLIDLGGVEAMLGWCAGMSEEDLWRRWLASPAVRAFESGRADPGAFAVAMVAEFELGLEPEQFLSAFALWPKRVHPEVPGLLARLAASHVVASFSNSNPLHWARVKGEMGLAQRFHRNFPSHEMGLLKPDREAFEHVAGELGVPPRRILFCDDNQLNVDGARSAGLTAERTRGFAELVACLEGLGVVAPG